MRSANMANSLWGVITNFVVTDAAVYLLSIYDKSEKENLSGNELDELLKSIPR